MAYSDFDLKKVRNAFGIRIDEQPDLFADVTPVQPGATLANTLAETAHLAMAINTAKARSELLITPVLRVLPANLLDSASASGDKGLGHDSSRQQRRKREPVGVST